MSSEFWSRPKETEIRSETELYAVLPFSRLRLDTVYSTHACRRRFITPHLASRAEEGGWVGGGGYLRDNLKDLSTGGEVKRTSCCFLQASWYRWRLALTASCVRSNACFQVCDQRLLQQMPVPDISQPLTMANRTQCFAVVDV